LNDPQYPGSTSSKGTAIAKARAKLIPPTKEPPSMPSPAPTTGDRSLEVFVWSAVAAIYLPATAPAAAPTPATGIVTRRRLAKGVCRGQMEQADHPAWPRRKVKLQRSSTSGR